jgi:hypothetical protein
MLADFFDASEIAAPKVQLVALLLASLCPTCLASLDSADLLL